MILDTSAILAILQNENQAGRGRECARTRLIGYKGLLQYDLRRLEAAN